MARVVLQRHSCLRRNRSLHSRRPMSPQLTDRLPRACSATSTAARPGGPVFSASRKRSRKPPAENRRQSIPAREFHGRDIQIRKPAQRPSHQCHACAEISVNLPSLRSPISTQAARSGQAAAPSERHSAESTRARRNRLKGGGLTGTAGAKHRQMRLAASRGLCIASPRRRTS